MRTQKIIPSLHPRLRTLAEYKARIEARIAAEMKRPLPDSIYLRSLKRLRLQAKDEAIAITKRLSSDGPSRPSAA